MRSEDEKEIPLTQALGAESEAEITAELQTYLEEKGLNSVFVKLVQELLLERPENAISFIVDYCFKNYPEQTEHFRQTRKKMSAIDGVTDYLEIRQVMNEQDEEQNDYSDDDADIFEENAQDMEVPTFEDIDTKPKTRRISVSAGVLSIEKQNETGSFKTFPKSAEEIERLKGILGKNMLCGHLDPAEQHQIIDAFEKTNVRANFEIITQGDTVAENYFVLDSGTAEVLKNGQRIVEYGAGDAFGELALMYNAPRAATVKSVSDCVVWRLDQKMFKLILMGSAIRRRDKYYQFLTKVEILKEMAETERNILCDALQEQVFFSGDIICEQGQPGDDFFIISEGEVTILVNGQEIGTLKEGQYFGEIALLTMKPRQATVRDFSESVKLLSVHRKVFQRVIGPLSDILKRNMKTYSHFVAGVKM